MHQNVLIFLKGDARAATAKILKEKQEAAEDDGE